MKVDNYNSVMMEWVRWDGKNKLLEFAFDKLTDDEKINYLQSAELGWALAVDLAHRNCSLPIELLEWTRDELQKQLTETKLEEWKEPELRVNAVKREISLIKKLIKEKSD